VSPEIRASDADRHAAVDALRSHYAAGRLETDELERRISKAVDAQTLGDLATLMTDLPATRGDRAAPRHESRVRGWGTRNFRQEHQLPASREYAWKKVMAHIAPAMAACGYSIVESHEPDFLVFELEEASVWPWLFIGPLAILAPKRKTRVAVSLLQDGPSRTTLVAAGAARRGVRKAFAAIADD
jgi:hypothetical protein